MKRACSLLVLFGGASLILMVFVPYVLRFLSSSGDDPRIAAFQAFGKQGVSFPVSGLSERQKVVIDHLMTGHRYDRARTWIIVGGAKVRTFSVERDVAWKTDWCAVPGG